VRLPSSRPPIRASKRQVTVYLDGDLDVAVRRRVEAEGWTLQQFLGNAINLELTERGVEPFLTIEKRHVFVRRQLAAAPRGATPANPGRAGRKCLAGWFERDEVERLVSFCQETGDTVQDLAMAGLRRALAA